MEYSLQKLSKTKVEIAISIDKEEWEAYAKEAYAKNKFKYSVEGFRKGKVPMNILINRYGKEFFYEEALDIAADKSYSEIIEKEKLQVITNPDFDVKSIGEDGAKFVITVIIKPEFELGQYKGLNFEKSSTEVSDEEVNKEIDKELNSRARLIEKDAPAEIGDTVIIDYSGKIGRKKFEGGTAEKQSLELGSKTFIPGFEEQLVGMNKGDKKDIEVTFPEDYGSKELAGKKATFSIVLHEVQKKELPVLDDEFIGLCAQFNGHRKILFLDIGKERVDIAHAGLEVRSAVGTRPQSADELRCFVTPHEADLFELLHDVAGVLRECVDKRKISLVVAGLPGLQSMKFGRVKQNGFFLCVVVLPLLGDFGDELFVKIALGLFSKDAFDDLALAFGHLDVALMNVGRVEASAANARIAARKTIFFKNNDFLAGFSGGHCCRKACAAGTDDDDVGIKRLGVG